jgi:transposase
MNIDGDVTASKRRVPNDEVLGFLSRHDGIEKVAMEASTSMMPLYRELKLNGYDIHVSHPKKTRLIAESRIKTDRVDSEALSELARLNALPLSYVPDEKTAHLREKVRRRAFLVRMRSKLKVKVRACLLYNGIKEPKEFGLFTRKGLAWLHSLEMDAIESYLPVISALSEQIEKLSYRGPT